ncbi:hypothetical protein [Nocardia sp. XZ_19_369]|uniref:hypothetical protein n=1 Tax=Nocardia sp. XZ_19_369 TaxID=2769487 RepID=UPI00188FB1C3|nr:hypothetical protein [Nocardia sp. XZ_19_369]
MHTSARSHVCSMGIQWCTCCVPSPDPADRPHLHCDLRIEFPLAQLPQPLIIQRSCRVYGSGLHVTTIDLLRSTGGDGFELTPCEARQLAELFSDPAEHYAQQRLFPISEDLTRPLVLYCRFAAGDDPRSYTLHLAQHEAGDHFQLTPSESQRLGKLLKGLADDES